MKNQSLLLWFLLSGLLLSGCTSSTDDPNKDNDQNGGNDESSILYVLNNDIYKMTKEMTLITKLTVSSATDIYRNPMTTSQANGIVFIQEHDDANYTNIMIMNKDGSNITNLTNTTDSGDWYGYPSISPDGKKILYCFSDNTTNGIYTMNIDGTGKVSVINSANNSYTNPLFTKDMRKIVFSTYDENKEFIDIAIINNDGSGYSKITSSTSGILCNFAGMSPDNTKILYTRGDISGIFSMDFNGNNQNKLLGPDTIEISYTNPKYSKDGSKIVFIGLVNKDYSNIFIANSDGTNIQNITKNSTTGVRYKEPSLIE